MKSAYFVCCFLYLATMSQSHSPSLLKAPQRSGSANAAFVDGGTVSRRTAHLLPSGLSFAAAVSYGSGGESAFSVAVADVNGDGKPDLLVANECASGSTCGIGDGVVGVLLGNGDGTFQTAVSYDSGGNNAVSVAVADVNGDGKPDLLVANECASISACGNGGVVAVLLGNGDGTFQTAISSPSGGNSAFSVAVADVNGDGKPDLLVANLCASGSNCSTGTSDGVVGVLLGNGDGTFQTAVRYDSGGNNAVSVAVADVNGDGRADIVVANQCGTSATCSEDGSVSVLLGNGDGTFQTAVSYDSRGEFTRSVTVVDVSGDGKLDLLVSNGCASGNCSNGVVSVLLGNGDGTFQTAVSYGSGGDSVSWMAVADVNGDGKLDLLVSNSCASSSTCSNGGVIGVLLGNGDGTFQTAVSYGSGGEYGYSVAAADVNRDGKPDLVAINECATGSSNCSNGSVGVVINTTTQITTAALVSSLNPSNLGQAVTFTATVTAQPFFSFSPTGTITFYDGATTLGTSSLNTSGVATLSISTLSIGTHSITATYSGDSNFDGSTSSGLSQVVQGALVQLNPRSVNYGNLTVGYVKEGVLINLTNIGNVALNISSIANTGDTVDFSENSLCPSSLQPNSSCTITATFFPQTVGTKNGAVTIIDNASDSPQSVSLTGAGVLPAVTLSPMSLTFPTQVVFTTSKAQTVTLTNTGLGILSINKIAITSQFAQTNTCGSTVNPGSSCTFTVTFKPSKAGSITGSISITDNASNSPQSVSLKGTGTDIQLIPASVNFGNQPVGTKSLPKKITLSNKSSTTVSITGITITGSNAGDFAQTNTCGTSVAGGASCFITVTFTPSAKGARSASVSVSDNGGGSPQKTALSGTGT